MRSIISITVCYFSANEEVAFMIMCAGEILFDLIDEHGDGVYTRHAGGAPFNVARALVSTGADVGFYGCVGNDGNGEKLKRIAEGCGFSRLIIDNIKTRNTTLAFVGINERGDRGFFFHARLTADSAPCAEKVGKIFEGADIAHLGSLPLRSAKGRTFAHAVTDLTEKTESKLSFDINYRDGLFQSKRAAYRAYGEVIDRADIIKFGEEELKDYMAFNGCRNGLRQAAEKLSLAKRGRLVFVTYGARGALLACDGGSVFKEAPHVEVKDTTGAGDAFLAGALAALDRGESAEQALCAAVALGAKACTVHGAL